MTHTKYHGSGRKYTEMELNEREDALANFHPRKSTYKPRITWGLLDRLLWRAKQLTSGLLRGRG